MPTDVWGLIESNVPVFFAAFVPLVGLAIAVVLIERVLPLAPILIARARGMFMRRGRGGDVESSGAVRTADVRRGV